MTNASYIGPIWMLEWHICNVNVIQMGQMYCKNWTFKDVTINKKNIHKIQKGPIIVTMIVKIFN